jgi:formylglycine-generating enzyme required for sulfatase activity
MRVTVVVAAMLFCMPVFAQGLKLKSVTNSIGMELIEIPAGKFTMGSPEDEKGHEDDEAQVSVTLTKPFSLGKTEVTQGQCQRAKA